MENRLLGVGMVMHHAQVATSSYIQSQGDTWLVLFSTTVYFYSGTCVLWTPWDQSKVSRLSRCPDFPGQFI